MKFRGMGTRQTAPLLATIVTSTLSLPIQAQTVVGLEEVVVSAQRREENAQEVPISVVVMDQESISRSQVNTLEDLPQVAPSLNFENRSVGAALNFSMRGIGAFAPNIGVQPGVGLVVDEIPFSRNVEYDVDLGDLSSIQFLNGPQGTLFGANNIGGVVLITTPDATNSFEGSAEASLTTDDEYIMRVVASGPLTDRIRARLSMYTKDREGFIENLYPLADVSGADARGGEESQGARLKLNIDVADSVSLTLVGDYRHSYTTDTSQFSDLGTPTRAAFVAAQGNGDPALGLEVARNPELINSDIPAYNTTDTWGVSANLAWDVSDTVTLKSISAYRELELFGVVDIDGSPATLSNPMGALFALGTRSNRGIYAEDDGKVNGPCGCNGIDNFKQEIRAEYSSERFDAVLGAYYLTEDSGQPDGVPGWAAGGYPLLVDNARVMVTNLANNETNLETLAGFGDVTWHVADALDLFAGYRWTEETLDLDFYTRTISAPSSQYTIVNDTVFFAPSVVGTVTQFDAEYESGEWAGRVGFMWHATSDINVYGSVARGFTGAGVVATATSPANAFVTPTTSLSYELGAKTQLFDNRVRFNVAVFKNDLEDIQASLFDTATVQTILVNAGDFTSQGVEMDVTALVGDNLTLNAVATLMDTELTSDSFQPCYFGQTAAQGCVVVGTLPNGQPATAQNVNGQPGINAPDLKYTLGASYALPFASLPFEGRAGVSYTWTDERYYELIYDPVASLAPSYGTLDLNFGISDKEGRYDISLFGKNVLDENFVTFTQSDAARNGRARAVWTRASFAYWGIKAKFNF